MSSEFQLPFFKNSTSLLEGIMISRSDFYRQKSRCFIRIKQIYRIIENSKLTIELTRVFEITNNIYLSNTYNDTCDLTSNTVNTISSKKIQKVKLILTLSHWTISILSSYKYFITHAK